MRITNNYTQQSSLTFGSVIATDKAIAYMNKKFSPKNIEKANKIIADQNGKQPNIYLSLGKFMRPGANSWTPFLQAKVGETVFEEGIFTSSFGVLKKAAKRVDKLIKKAQKKDK